MKSDRRVPFVEWLTSKDNPYFAQVYGQPGLELFLWARALSIRWTTFGGATRPVE